MSKTPIATLNLLGKPTQALVSIMGVAFALLLMFVQLGFRGAVANTATIVYGKLDFDVILRGARNAGKCDDRCYECGPTNEAGHVVSP